MTQNNEREALILKIVRDVAELPDRNSPDDQPEMMLVSSAELTEILKHNLAQSPISQNEQQEAAAWRYKFTKNGDWKYLSVYPNGCEDSCPVFVDALYTSPPKQIPDGWKLVPIEPTKEMLKACDIDISARNTHYSFHDHLSVYYKAMLNATPTNTGTKKLVGTFCSVHNADKSKCQLHNLQCAYPSCCTTNTGEGE